MILNTMKKPADGVSPKTQILSPREWRLPAELSIAMARAGRAGAIGAAGAATGLVGVDRLTVFERPPSWVGWVHMAPPDFIKMGSGGQTPRSTVLFPGQARSSFETRLLLGDRICVGFGTWASKGHVGDFDGVGWSWSCACSSVGRRVSCRVRMSIRRRRSQARAKKWKKRGGTRRLDRDQARCSSLMMGWVDGRVDPRLRSHLSIDLKSSASRPSIDSIRVDSTRVESSFATASSASLTHV